MHDWSFKVLLLDECAPSPAKDSFMLSKLMKIREPAIETKKNFDAD
jgi:hypothetical protein